jgi:hypothetical protein
MPISTTPILAASTWPLLATSYDWLDGEIKMLMLPVSFGRFNIVLLALSCDAVASIRTYVEDADRSRK